MPAPVRTGYEWMMAFQMNGSYTHLANEDGVVVSRNKRKDAELLTVRYKSSQEVSFELGVKFVNSKGHTYKHTYVSEYKEGDEFKKDDCLVYCKEFFIPDILNKGRVIFLLSGTVTTAIVDFLETLEDGSCVSQEGSQSLVTEEVNKRNIVIDASHEIMNLLSVGTVVESDDILCTLEDPLLAKTSSVYNAVASDALKRLAGNTPRCRYRGKIEKIDMMYFCNFEELSPSLQKLAKECDSHRAFVSKSTNGSKAVSGQLYEPTRVHGEQVNRGQVVLTVYISYSIGMAAGDKHVVANQLKSVVTRNLVGTNETESGLRIDSWFGYQSISNRIVQSPELMGILNRLLRVLTERAVAAYDS